MSSERFKATTSNDQTGNAKRTGSRAIPTIALALRDLIDMGCAGPTRIELWDDDILVGTFHGETPQAAGLEAGRMLRKSSTGGGR